MDRGERHAVGVHAADGDRIFAQAEGRAEVLRHRAQVPDRVVLRAIAPRGQRQTGHAGEHFAGIDGLDVRLRVAIAEGRPRTAAGGEPRARRADADLPGHESHTTKSARGEFIRGRGGKVRIATIRQHDGAVVIGLRATAGGEAVITGGGVVAATGHGGEHAGGDIARTTADRGKITCGAVATGLATTTGDDRAHDISIHRIPGMTAENVGTDGSGDEAQGDLPIHTEVEGP